MSLRPLVFVLGLTVGDYLLWNWSLNSNHDVLALVSGLTLPPLAVASLWLLALSGARLIASRTRRQTGRSARRGAGRLRRRRGQPTTAAAPLEEAPASAASASRSSGKLAA